MRRSLVTEESRLSKKVAPTTSSSWISSCGLLLFVCLSFAFGFRVFSLEVAATNESGPVVTCRRWFLLLRCRLSFETRRKVSCFPFQYRCDSCCGHNVLKKKLTVDQKIDSYSLCRFLRNISLLQLNDWNFSLNAPFLLLKCAFTSFSPANQKGGWRTVGWFGTWGTVGRLRTKNNHLCIFWRKIFLCRPWKL